MEDQGVIVPLQVRELRERARGLPLDYLVVLVGDMITEEALPTYMAMLNTLDGVRDETGMFVRSTHGPGVALVSMISGTENCLG